MRAWASILIALLCGATSWADPDQAFIEGTKAYDEGRYADAARHYEQIVDDGYTAAPVFYNLGNVWFKQGDFPRAALYYLRAKALAPRDTELNANLDFTFQQLDAPREEPSLHWRAAQRLSEREWRTVSTLAFWLGTVGLMLFLILPSFRIHTLRTGLGCWILSAACLVPLFLWSEHRQQPMAVLLKDSSARYAPLENAAVHYKIPQGSVARQIDVNGNWIKISSQGKEAWVTTSEAHPVFPLPTNPSP